MKPMKRLFTIPLGYNDNFGDYSPTDTDLSLYDAMIASRLPSDVEWFGNELFAVADSPLFDEDMAAIWADAADDAYDEFCSVSTNAMYLQAAEHYGVTVPDDYDPGMDA